MPKRFIGLAITAGLVAVAAVVGGVILFTSSRASEVNLTTASLVPEDAGIYVALNTDLSSSQWVNTFRLAERLGADDPEGDLKDGADTAGLDWEDDVAPFLGGNAALYVQGFSLDDLNARLDQPVPMNRFRPNLVFTGGQPFEEDTWQNFTIGSNRFRGVKPCARCVLTTIDQETSLAGKEPLRTLAAYRTREHKVYFGQNAIAIDHEKISEGDVVEVG